MSVHDHDAGSRITYTNPPVTETSLGLQFAPVAGWDVHLFGSYLQIIRDRYPKFSSAPPIMLAQVGSASLEFNVFPPTIRGLYTSSNGADVVQIQDGFFLVNWRRVHGEDYSRYVRLQERFERDWNDFIGLLVEKQFPAPLPTRCLLTYIDHAEQHRFSAHDLLRDWSQTPARAPRAVTISTAYQFEDGAEATITLQPALRITDNKAVHQLTIAAASAYAKDASMTEQFAKLHAHSLELFNTLTSPEAQQRWGKEPSR